MSSLFLREPSLRFLPPSLSLISPWHLPSLVDVSLSLKFIFLPVMLFYFSIFTSFSFLLFAFPLNFNEYLLDTYFRLRNVLCSVTKSCPALCDPMDYSTPGFPVLHYLLEFAQIHVPSVGNAIWPSHPLPLSIPFAFNLSQHQGLFQWVSFSHQVLKHQSYQWILWLISFRIAWFDLLQSFKQGLPWYLRQ